MVMDPIFGPRCLLFSLNRACVTNIMDGFSGRWLIMSFFDLLDRSNRDLCLLNSFARLDELSGVTCVAHEAFQSEPFVCVQYAVLSRYKGPTVARA